MQFIVIADGIPVHVHKHTQPTEKQFWFQAAPPGDKPHIYRCGDEEETIYGFLFMLTANQLDAMDSAQRKSLDWPRVFSAFTKVMELAYASDKVSDYGGFLKSIYDIIPEEATLITNKGARSRNHFITHAMRAIDFGVIGHKEQQPIIAAYTNILDRQISVLEKSILEAHQSAVDTGVLGEFYQAKIPSWWHDANTYWSTKNHEV